MANAHDVAAYILERAGAMTTMKLQKLVYYSQAWSLVWDERPMFEEPIEAWANGPVIPELYDRHRGKFKVASWPTGQASKLSQLERETVDAVLNYYGDRNSQWLSDLTHSESPWQDARAGLPASTRGNSLISPAALAEYYGGLSGTE